MAVRALGGALRWVPEAVRTQKICFEAVREDPLALKWVPKEFRTEELLRVAEESEERADPIRMLQEWLNACAEFEVTEDAPAYGSSASVPDADSSDVKV